MKLNYYKMGIACFAILIFSFSLVSAADETPDQSFVGWLWDSIKGVWEYWTGGEIIDERIPVENSGTASIPSEWVVTSTTDTQYTFKIDDKYSQNTRICMVSKSGLSLSNTVPVYDSKGVKLTDVSKSKEDGKDAYCYEITSKDYIKFGEHSTIIEYQESNLIDYQFDWGNTTIQLLKEGKIEEDIFVFWDNPEGKWEFGADDSAEDGLNNMTYIINSTDEFVLLTREIDVNAWNYTTNQTYLNYTYAYPKIYNYNPNGWDELRHWYSLKGACEYSYSNCEWTLSDDKKLFILNFVADDYFVTKSITNVSGCQTLNANTHYILNQSVDGSGQTCMVIGGNNVTLDFDGYNITGNAFGGDDEYGISTAYNDTEINDGIISGFTAGIYSINNFLLNVTGGDYSDNGPDDDGASGNNGYGIYLGSSNNYTLRNFRVDDITHSAPSWSCPFLFVFDGQQYVLEDDVFNQGMLGVFNALGRRKAYPNDYEVIDKSINAKNGKYRIEIRETPDELVFIDKLKMYYIDIPEDKDIIVGASAMTTIWELEGTQEIKEELNTVHLISKTPQTPVSCIDKDGDCLSKITNKDDELTDAEQFQWNIVTLDLGNLENEEEIKLVMSGVTNWPSQLEWDNHPNATGTVPAFIEVIDENGNWVNAGYIPIPNGFKEAYAFPINDIFLTNDYRIRLNIFAQSFIDYVAVDTTKDNIELIELELDSAKIYNFGENNGFIGNVTKYGEVSELLNETDDMYAIFLQGDGIRAYFNEEDAELEEGYERRYVMDVVGYFKQEKYGLEREVGQLPFYEMSNYPYNESIENYPDDAEHNAYQEEWNTRVIDSGGKHNTKYGIYTNSDYGLFSNVSGSNNDDFNEYGLFLTSTSDYNFIENSEFYDQGYGIYIQGDYNTITGTIIHTNSVQGIHIATGNHNIITNINSSNNAGNGVNFVAASNNTLTNSIFNDNQNGVFMQFANYHNFNNLTSNGNNGALFFNEASFNNFTNITMDSNEIGIYFFASSSEYNHFNGFRVTGSTQPAFGAVVIPTGVSNNTFENGYINDTVKYGIQMYSYGGITNNNVFRNILINNSGHSDFRVETTGGGVSLNNTLINVTYPKADNVSQLGGVITYIRKWYFSPQVNFTHNGTAVSGANITAWNIMETEKNTELTNNDGQFTTNWELIEYIYDGTVKEYQTNYTFNATKDGWGTDSQEINLTTNYINHQFNLDDITPPTCTLISRTPTDINDSSTGDLNIVINCTDISGMNVTKTGDHYSFFITRTVDSFLLAAGIPNYWSIRYPNNSLGVTGALTPPFEIWRALGRNEGYWYEDITDTTMRDCTGVSPCYAPLNDTFSFAIEDGEYGHFEITNGSDWALINYTHPSVQLAAFRQVIYLSWESQVAEQKKNQTIFNKQPVLIKGFDPEAYRSTSNYSANLFVNLGVIGVPVKTLRMWYCNSSYDPTGSTQTQDSSNCVFANSLTKTEIDVKDFTERNSTFNRGTFGVTNGLFGGVKTTAEYYLSFQTPQASTGKYYQIKYMNGTTNTDVRFNETNVAWTSTDEGVTWVQAAWTPDMFLTFTREANDDFMFGVYACDLVGNCYKNFTMIQDEITQTNHPISFPLVLEYNSSLLHDNYLNGTHAGTMQVLVGIAIDPDSVGNVTHNLTLRNLDGTYNYTINGSFKSPTDSDLWIDFNTDNVRSGNYRTNITATAGDNPLDIKSRATDRNFTIDNYPTAPIIITPITDLYDGDILIWYAAGTNSTPAFYNITLTDTSGTYIQTIASDNGNDLTYLWDSTGVANDDYKIRVSYCNQWDECNSDLSNMFTVSNFGQQELYILPEEKYFTTGQIANVTTRCRMSNGSNCFVPTACRITSYYPNRTLLVENEHMINSAPLYSHNFGTLTTVGAYNSIVFCYNAEVNGTASFNFDIVTPSSTLPGVSRWGYCSNFLPSMEVEC